MKTSDPFESAGNPAYRVGLFAVALGFFGSLYALWLAGQRDAYFGVTSFIGIDAWIRPFLDLEGVLSWGECHRLSFDVLKSNPCDPLHRLLNYGPPLIHLPLRARDAAVLGVAQALLFLGAVPLAIRPRSPGELAVAVAAILSTATLYAMERGNLDLFEFALIALTGPLFARGGAGPFCSYAVYYAAGAMKFYPFALLLMVLRERRRAALIAAALSALAIGAYAALYWPQLAAIASLLPQFEYDSDSFGAAALPFGLADLLGLPRFFGIGGMVLLLAGFGTLAIRLALRLSSAMTATDWDRAEFHYLLAGSIVMSGCFLLQTNIDYRAIFLLLMPGGLFVLRNRASAKPLRGTFSAAIAVLVFCLWSDFFRRGIDHALDRLAPDRSDNSLWDQLANAFFVGRELAWWWLMSVAVSIVLLFVLTSPLGAAATAWLARLRQAEVRGT